MRTLKNTNYIYTPKGKVKNKNTTTKGSNKKQRGQLFTDDNPETTIHGYGFNTPSRVKHTLSDLAMRDIGYQFQVVNTMLQRGRQVLWRTHNPVKKKQIQAGLRLYEDWIADYHRQDRYAAENHPYLPLLVIRRYQALADEYRIRRHEYMPFLQEYSRAKTPAEMRLISINRGANSISVDKYRNALIFKIIGRNRDTATREWLYGKDGLPSARHLRLIMLGYSPVANKISRTQ
jgi:hypothetical protein